MEFNRNQFFAIGVVILFVGLQFRHFESFTLNAEASEFIRDKMSGKKAAAMAVSDDSSYSGYNNSGYGAYDAYQAYAPASNEDADTNYWGSAQPTTFGRTMKITPPKWIGWALLSAGGVLMLHSLAMKRPD